MGGVDVDERGGFRFVLFEFEWGWGATVMRRLVEGFAGVELVL